MAAVVRQMAQMSMMDKIRTLTGLGRAAASTRRLRIMPTKVGTGKRLSPKEREKLRKQRKKKNAAAGVNSEMAPPENGSGAGTPDGTGGSVGRPLFGSCHSCE